MENTMYVVIAEELEEFVDRCGYAYHFEPGDDCWRLVLTDVECPSHSPDPIISTYKKLADAKHDLIAQAVDGRLKGYMAVRSADLERRRAEAVAAMQ